MTSTSLPKKLREHLHEQQEPFALETYISERRILLNKNPDRACRCNLKKRRILPAKEILKLILYKFIWHSHSKKGLKLHKAHRQDLLSNANENSHSIGRTASVSERSNSIALLPRNYRAPKYSRSNKRLVVGDTNFQWGSKQDSEQLSPVSVLNGISSSSKVCQFMPRQEQEASRNALSKTTEEDCALSAFLWELLLNSMPETNQNHCGLGEVMEKAGPDLPHHMKNIRALQQNKQLLFDSVNEAIKMHRRNSSRGKHVQEFTGVQELGKFICENICSWEKQDASQHRKVDCFSTIEDKDYFQQQSKMTGAEIGDIIMDEIIQEIVDLLLL
ncbi:hypothetical protein K2173_023847 [Erythroxylum novogranatense]|uniref:DUF4378 domain-containing protein n=1 Tax=Erythroxylum novogranatense TaxID=1862640 RepID=A0AAV8TPI6_9ROSI|nr:hypothetical protein K2173_023847 [Erythroxylum novogranatense]